MRFIQPAADKPQGSGRAAFEGLQGSPLGKGKHTPPEPVTLATVPGLVGRWEGGRWCLEEKPNARTRLLSCCVPDKWYTEPGFPAKLHFQFQNLSVTSNLF